MDLLNLKEIYFGYNEELLKDISLSIKNGEFISLLGINGAGKSTLLKNIVGLLKIDRGAIYLKGKNLENLSFKERSKTLTYVSQYNQPGASTVFETVLVGRVPYIEGKPSENDYLTVEKILKEMNLEKYALRETFDLSGGEFQKVVIARALAQEPEILLLDEPTSNLDIKNQIDVMNLVKKYCKQKNISVILSIHDINLALQFSDKFLLLKDGRVFDYGGSSVINKESIFQVYGINVEILDFKDRKILFTI